MKEAAGEANMTVLTIILIGVVLGAGYLIVDRLMKRIQNESDEKIKIDTAYVINYNEYI